MLRTLPFGPSDSKLLIEESLLERLSTFRQVEGSAREAGGILIGYRRGPHTHITECTVPSQWDIRHRFGFFRHGTHHQRVALRRWSETDRMLDYVGEWHTHPENDPTPSWTDVHHWRRISAASKRPMILVIVGRAKNWIGARLGESIRGTAGL